GQGFLNVTGFDPYVSKDWAIGRRMIVRKCGVDALPSGWDLIMLNHSFEHMAEQQSVLQGLRARLNKRGVIIIRTPIADSWAYRVFGADWVQLDAPRHLLIHTQRSMHILAARAGLAVWRVFF